MALPLFNDEAVYLLRAQRFPAMLMADPRSSSATLPEGKLLQELCLALLARLPGDPLLPARLLSVLCGLGTVLVMIQIGRQLACPGCGMLAGLLYALSPLAQIHDRLAISDSMLTMVGAGLLLVSVRYATNEQADRGQALGIGALLGTAALVKLTGILLAALPVLAVLLLTPANQRRGRIALLRLSIIVALLPIAALAPFHYGGAERQKIGTETSRILLAWQNIKHIASWLTQYLPVPLLLIPLAALGVGHWRQQPKDSAQKGLRQTVAFLLVAGLALPLTLIGLGGSLASRYILPAWPGLLVAIGLGSKLLWEQSDRRWPARKLVIVSLGL
ncbi:MAG: phospholipid carrier-dependent glycosyltransferase, partial [Oscillochloris sp.]|nr:phospholipid carrier-dependent glycosyltransferase [Oscillochloris sp.]